MQSKIYSLKEHSLSLDAIDKDALYVMEKLTAAGFTAYLVGGSVRDLLLQQTPKDYDISTSAKPEEIRSLFRNSLLIGRRFRLAHIRFGKKIIEVATFRSGAVDDDNLIIRDNEWGSSEEDVLRRDFTINGLFYDAVKQEIIDYVGGYEDLQKRYLRSIGIPYVRFKQDPVRMIRLLKFQARFGLHLDPEAKVATLECRKEILKSSQARILEEIFRMLESGASSNFIKLLSEYGFLELLLPSLDLFLDSEEGSDIYAYLQEIDNKIKENKIPPSRSLLIAALLWPYLNHLLKIRFIERKKHPHLGDIHQLCHEMFIQVFQPFFLIPKRLKAIASSLMIFQYRLTPLLEKRPIKKYRFINHPDFQESLALLELRSFIEPALKSPYEEWKSLLSNSHIIHDKPTHFHRRRHKPHSSKRHENPNP